MSGAVSVFFMPRGPVSAIPGVAEMATGPVLGAFAGLLLQKRRAVLLVLLAHVVTLELVRLPYNGPTVDGIHLGSLYGAIAFAMRRGFQGLLLFFPALVGVIYGAGPARWLSRESAPRRWTLVLRRIFAGGLAVVMAAAVCVVAQPAHTEPMTGADGNVVAGSIAELSTAHVGGHDTTLMLRGNSTKAPVLLYLAGGPGGTDLGAMRLFGEALENDFLVATWDQRGQGLPMVRSTRVRRSLSIRWSITQSSSSIRCALASTRTRSTSSAIPGALFRAFLPFKNDPTCLRHTSEPDRW